MAFMRLKTFQLQERQQECYVRTGITSYTKLFFRSPVFIVPLRLCFIQNRLLPGKFSSIGDSSRNTTVRTGMTAAMF
jgi:hypothetical protein